MDTKPHVLLLTGVPGVGKTTVIKKFAALLPGLPVAGFYTEEIRQYGRRQGFRLVAFNGVATPIAGIDSHSTRRVGKYGVDVAAIDAAAAMTLSQDDAMALYIVDEVGKMECLSDRFLYFMRLLLQSSKPLVATVAAKGGGFIQEIKQRDDKELWKVTPENRNRMAQRLLAWVSLRVPEKVVG